MTTIQTARELLSKALSEIDAERDRLSKALIHLDGGSPLPRRGRPSKGRSAARKRKGKRAPKGQRNQQFLDAVRAEPGITVAQAAEKIGVPASQLYPVARRLHKEKAISKRGVGYRIKSPSKLKKSV